MKFGDCQVCMAFLAGVRISQTELLKKFGEMVGGRLLANAKLLIHFSVLKYQKNLVSHKYLEPPFPQHAHFRGIHKCLHAAVGNGCLSSWEKIAQVFYSSYAKKGYTPNSEKIGKHGKSKAFFFIFFELQEIIGVAQTHGVPCCLRSLNIMQIHLDKI